MREARKIKTMREDQRRNMIKVLAEDVQDCLDLDEREHSFRQSMWYLFTKCLFLGNIVLQFVLVGAFIGRGYNAWFWNIIISVFGLNDSYNERWVKAPVFPTDALCDFIVRQLGNSHRHTIQCMLSINQFNEKIFLFFSVYFGIVGVITLLNTISWVLSLLVPSERKNVVRRLIKKDKLIGEENERKLLPFVNKALKTDGILLLHFIKGTAGAFVARDVCTQLFVAYTVQHTSPTQNCCPENPPPPIGFKEQGGFRNGNLKTQFGKGFGGAEKPKAFYNPQPVNKSRAAEVEAMLDNDYNKALRQKDNTESSESSSEVEPLGYPVEPVAPGFGSAGFGGGNSFATTGFGNRGFGTNSGYGAAPADNLNNDEWGDSEQTWN